MISPLPTLSSGPNGGWTTNDISPAGLLVRQELRAKNPVPVPAAKL
jgi:hypothetical protein